MFGRKMYGGRPMLVIGIIGCITIVYLGFVLVKPEKF
ncbi:potassium-transporting ATPase subunit F [Paenibacillus sp. N3.4]|nr:potassium-transporting ATPase subunit F [Paenibacillus sp. N3.4]